MFLKKAIELSASGIEGALLLLGAVADQWSALIINSCKHKLIDRLPAKTRRLMQTADEFAAQEPQIVAMPVQGFA